MTRPNGIVLYIGPSMLDGAPIVVVATGIARASKNAKTGSMIQTWILREDLSPVEAAAIGADASICGSCPHRPANVGTCYVRLSDAPLAVWRAYKRGAYPIATTEDLMTIGDGRKVRAGSYGDPVAVPWEIWALLGGVWTGYTHQWRRPEAEPYRAILMASVDTEAEASEAHAMGWRTFRVRDQGAALQDGEIECVSVSRGTTCEDCGLCAGTTLQGAKSIAIEAHGTRKNRFMIIGQGA